MTANHSAAHSELVARCLVYLSERGAMAWRAPTGVAKLMASRGLIRFGVPGQSDILGVLPPAGRFLAVECKTGRGSQSADQRTYQAAIERHGGLYLVVRNVTDLDRLWR